MDFVETIVQKISRIRLMIYVLNVNRKTVMKSRKRPGHLKN